MRRYREQQTVDGAAVYSLLFAVVLSILLHGWFDVSRGLKPISQLRYDKTTIRRIRRYHEAFDYDGSDRNYDSAAIRLRQ